MKKLISLLLVLVLTMGLLAGVSFAVSFEKPDECAQADAVVKVTAGNNSYYFGTLLPSVVHWARRDLEGAKTITLLKDVVLDPANGDHAQRYFELTASLGDWNGRNGTKNPIIFDLGGHTLTLAGEGAMFYCQRFGLTVKNGTIDFTSEGRSCIAVSTSTGYTAISSGSTLWQPQVVLEDMTIVTKGGSAILNHCHGTQITIKDSNLLSTKGAVLNLGATDQTGIGSSTPYTGDFKATVDIENSTLVGGKNYAFVTSRDEYEITIQDSMIVSNGKAATMYNDQTAPNIDTKGMDIAPVSGWTGEVAGTAVTGNAYAIGEAPGTQKVELPFTDVKEGDWYYEFVKDLYSKKIVAGQTETTFNPGGNLTYAAALKLLVVGLTGKDAGNAASGHWATNYLSEAVTAGWTAIGADKLDAPITREAFCEIAAKAKNLTEKAENPFKDTNNDAVLALVKAGVISGMSADTFAPAGILTRAQISKIICTLRQVPDGNAAEKEAEHMKNTTPPEHPIPTVEELKQKGEVYYVGKNREHKSFVSLLLDLTGNENQKTIFIDEGEYDIFAEYRAEVKAGRIAVPPDTIGNATYMEASDGKWYNAFVPNNTVIYGLGNVTLRFTPDKDEITYGESRVWSPLNVFGSVEMYNLNVLVKNGRYCLHNDDHNRYPNSFQYYYNCRFEYQLGDMKTEDKRLGFNSTIGFGINDNSTHVFDKCEIYFNGEGNRGGYYGHDASKGKESAWIFLKDCHLHASDPTNNRVIRLQTLAKNVSDRPIHVTILNCKVNGGLQFNMYYAESIQSFDVTFKNTPEMPISRTNSKGPVKDPYTVKYENG